MVYSFLILLLPCLVMVVYISIYFYLIIQDAAKIEILTEAVETLLVL